MLNVGGPGLVPVAVNAGQLSIQNGGTLTVQTGSSLSTNSSSINGNVIVDTSAHWNDNSPPMYSSIGNAGGDGSVTIQNGGIVTFVDLGVATDVTLSTGIVRVDGANSLLSTYGDVSVGSYTVGQGTIDVGTISSDGTMTTPSGGLFHIYTTGTVNVSSSSTTGTLNANGDVIVDGGVLRVDSGSQFNLGHDWTLHIQNGGTADFKSFNINGSKVVFGAGVMKPRMVSTSLDSPSSSGPPRSACWSRLGLLRSSERGVV
jgi:hypothetical protein